MLRFHFPLFIALCLAAGVAYSQDGGDRGRYDPAERLRALDTNGDGKLEPSELPERFRPFIERRLRDAGMDPNKPVEVETYLGLMRGDRGSRDDNDDDDRRDRSRRDDDNRRSQRRSDEEIPLVPGFGEEFERTPVPGFGIASGDGAGKSRNQGVTLEERYHEKIVAYADSILRRYDRNRDGFLSQDEWSRGRWRSPRPEESDLNRDGRLAREELCERVKGYDDFKGLNASSSSGASRSSASSSDDRGKYLNYAKGLMSRYDRNDNGVLDENEWKTMSQYHQGADADGDKRITTDELADRLAQYGKSGSSSTTSSGRSSSSSSSQGDRDSYRASGGGSGYNARDAKDRLPKGLPSWFAEKDTNDDGQIAMAEYASTWNDERIEEFQSYDANADGLITPEECLDSKR